MSSAPTQATSILENEGGVLVALRRQSPPRHIARSGKRAEDTAAGCRANAAADLGRAGVPGGDFMRLRLEHSAAVWSERADLLERLEKKFRDRARPA
ncbi:MAG TPA: hypothetical protein VGW40_08060 [Allosphingosinicella sp.]|nr:hypothetical protein [Allosphingosinicella sp.]